MSAHVLLNSLNELGKRDNNTRARVLGPVHMHTFTYVSKVTYVSKFTYGACERTYSREYKYSWSKLG